MHVRAVEQDLEAVLLFLLREDKRFCALQFFHINIAVIDLAAVCLKLYLIDRGDWQTAVPEIFHDDVICNQFAVEIYGNAVAYHTDEEGIPLAELIIRNFQRLRFVHLVIIQTAGTHLRTDIDARRVPNLYLRGATEVNTGVGLGSFRVEHPIDVHFDVSILLDGA